MLQPIRQDKKWGASARKQNHLLHHDPAKVHPKKTKLGTDALAGFDDI
jgi:hypothetical protein